MNQIWEYKYGNWHVIENPLRYAENADLDVLMREAGYEKEGVYGSAEEYLPTLELWQHKKDTPITERYYFMVWVGLTGDTSYPVYFPDLPSLLMFLRDFAPVMQQQGQAEFFRKIEMALEKGFHAWHGHYLEYDVCPECDPNEVEMRRIHHEERRQRAAAAAQQRKEGKS